MRFRLLHWCIAAAVLANVVVYFHLNKKEAPPATVGDPADLRRLVLLSELDEPPAPASTVADPVPAAVVQTDPVPVEVAGATIESGSDLDSASPSIEEERVEEPEVAAAPPEPELEEIIVPQRARLEPPPRCWLAGPVNYERLSARLTADFAAAGISLDLVLQTVEVAPDHWVYLRAGDTQTEVRRLSRELRQSGIDNFQITDGPLAGSLSLGLFRSQQSAETVRAELRERGYEAEIFLRPRYLDEAWVALDDPGREALGWPAENGPVPRYSDLTLRQRQCP